MTSRVSISALSVLWVLPHWKFVIQRKSLSVDGNIYIYIYIYIYIHIYNFLLLLLRRQHKPYHQRRLHYSMTLSSILVSLSLTHAITAVILDNDRFDWFWYYHAGILEQCSFSLILEALGIFLFFWWRQVDFNHICRGWICNKTSASDSYTKYIGSSAVLYADVCSSTGLVVSRQYFLQKEPLTQ